MGGGVGGEVNRLSAALSRSALELVKESPSPSPKRSSSSSLELVSAFLGNVSYFEFSLIVHKKRTYTLDREFQR